MFDSSSVDGHKRPSLTWNVAAVAPGQLFPVRSRSTVHSWLEEAGINPNI